MSFDWVEYLYLAQETADMRPDKSYSVEAKLRVAISRAYYAAFCQARNYLVDNSNFNLVNYSRVIEKQMKG